MVGATRWVDPVRAVATVAARMAGLVRSLPAAPVKALGEWDTNEVATHVTQVFELDADLAAGAEGPLDDIAGLGDFTKAMVDQEAERDPRVLAGRIEAAAERFAGAMAAAPAEGDVSWLGGIQLPVSALPGHVLNEALLHGVDLARAADRSWRVESAHALVAVRDFLFPLMQRLDPEFFLTDRGRAARTSYEVQARGGGAVRLDFGGGTVVVHPPTGDPVDCRISADPAALLQVIFGRKSQWRAILGGQLLAWGRRPWLGPQLTSMVRSP